MARAYVISDVTLKDELAADAYRAAAAASIAAHGGRYLVRGGNATALEGEWRPQFIVLVEFPDRSAAEAWYHSPDYALALAHRDAALSRDLILLDGAPAPPEHENP